MADGQGTGKHPHKSAADPTEHHEAASSKSESKGKSTEHTPAKHAASSHESDGQGTGKHPHKSAADPKEHHEGAKK